MDQELQRSLTPPPGAPEIAAALAVGAALPKETITLDRLVSWILTTMTTIVLAIVAFWASELQEQVHKLSTNVASISDRTSRLEVKLDSVREKIDDLKRIP